MQVNRLSVSLQEALKTATNFNTSRNETLFNKNVFEKDEQGKIDFEKINTDDLNINQGHIAKLLGSFEDEIINVFSSNLFGDWNGNTTEKENSNKNTVFTA